MPEILMVIEGLRPDGAIIQSLNMIDIIGGRKNPFKGSLHHIYGQNISQIGKAISEDPFVDTFMLITDNRDGTGFDSSQKLRELGPGVFTDIYLFFDFDPEKTPLATYFVELGKLINIFNNSTDAGLLLISYPMAEAYRAFTKSISFQKAFRIDPYIHSKFKQLVAGEGFYQGSPGKVFEQDNLFIGCLLTVAQSLVGGKVLKDASQDIILEAQKALSLIDGKILVLSGFAFLFLDRFGGDFYTHMIHRTGVAAGSQHVIPGDDVLI